MYILRDDKCCHEAIRNGQVGNQNVGCGAHTFVSDDYNDNQHIADEGNYEKRTHK